MYHAFEKYEESHDARRELEQLVDSCQLDVFIYICRIDYVGTDTVDTVFYSQEVCNEISQLCQVFKYRKGRTFTDTPEDLYQNSLIIQ